MRRRHVIKLLVGTAAAAPFAAHGQAPSSPVIGFFSSGSPYEWAPFVAAFRKGLSEIGYVEGRNASIEVRWTFGDREQVSLLARDLVERRVDVIVTSGGGPPTSAALKLTKTIPIVASFGDNPIKQGWVASLEHPGGNVTGVSLLAQDLETKRLKLLRDIVPKAALIAVIADPTIPPAADSRRDLEEAAHRVGQKLTFVSATTEADIDEAFAKIAQQGAGALLVSSTAYYLDRRDRFAALSMRYAIPTMFSARAYVDAGGLISYGVDRLEAYHQLGIYTGRILRGDAKPADMPVQQPTKFELAINLKTAKALGVTIPPALVTLADAMIQ
jgi:putative ABC transport system substrate-binding protein